MKAEKWIWMIILLFCIAFLLFFRSSKENIEPMKEQVPIEENEAPKQEEAMKNQEENPVPEEETLKEEENKKGHWEEIPVYEPPYDERVLLKEAWTETILVKDAWDEEETYCYAFGQDSYEGYECSCGKVSGSLDAVMQHIREDENCGSWHNKTIYYGESHCLEYKTDYIHHDPEYKQIYHEAEYETVHHEGRTYYKKVWVEE